MVKYNIALLITATLLLVGCPSNPPRVTTETIEVKVPIMYCPAPPKFPKPKLPLHNMTPGEVLSDGELVKHYKASMHMLINHADDLQSVLDQYEKVSTSYEELEKKMLDNVE